MEKGLEAILSLVRASAALGAAEVSRVHLPSDDKLSRSELVRHLRRSGVDYPEKWIACHESDGSIHRRKRGERNSKVTYSLVEIQGVLVSERMFAINNYKS